MFEAFCQTQLLVLRPLKLTLPKLKMMDYRITKSTTLLPRISSTSFKRVGSFRLIGKLFHPCCFLVGCYVFFMIHNLPPQIKRPQETGTKVSTFFACFFCFEGLVEYPGAKDNASQSPDVPMIFRSDTELWPEVGGKSTHHADPVLLGVGATNMVMKMIYTFDKL